MPICIGTTNVADKNMSSRIVPCLNALENKIEHSSTLSCCRIEDGCDERSPEQNSCRKDRHPFINTALAHLCRLINWWPILADVWGYCPASIIHRNKLCLCK